LFIFSSLFNLVLLDKFVYFYSLPDSNLQNVGGNATEIPFQDKKRLDKVTTFGKFTM
jgi:hypothetical protein